MVESGIDCQFPIVDCEGRFIDPVQHFSVVKVSVVKMVDIQFDWRLHSRLGSDLNF